MDELHNNLKGMATPIIYQPIDNADERTKIVRQLWGRLIVLSILIGVLFAGAISIKVTQDGMTAAIENARVEAADNVLISRENGYRNRAVNCQLAVALSQPLLDTCKDPEVIKYYNPLEAPTAGGSSPAQTKLRALICLDLRSRGIAPENCEDVETPVPAP